MLELQLMHVVVNQYVSISRTPITSRYKFIRLNGTSVYLRNFGVKDYLWSLSICTPILIELDWILTPLNFCDVTKRCTMPSVGPIDLRHPAHDSRCLHYHEIFAWLSSYKKLILSYLANVIRLHAYIIHLYCHWENLAALMANINRK